MELLYLILWVVAIIAALVPSLRNMARASLMQRNRYAIYILGAVVGLQQFIAFTMSPRKGVDAFWYAMESYGPACMAILVLIAAERIMVGGKPLLTLPQPQREAVPEPETKSPAPVVENPEVAVTLPQRIHHEDLHPPIPIF